MRLRARLDRLTVALRPKGPIRIAVVRDVLDAAPGEPREYVERVIELPARPGRSMR